MAEPAGKTYGARALSVSERAGLALDLCDSEAPLKVVLRGREGLFGTESQEAALKELSGGALGS